MLRLLLLLLLLFVGVYAQRLKPAEILGLKEEVLNRLEVVVRQTLAAAAAPYRRAAATAAPDAPAASASASPVVPQLMRRPDGTIQGLTQKTLAEAEPSAPVSVAAAAAAAVVGVVTPHDLCMLIRSFADLTPGDSALIIRLLYTLLLVCRAPPSVPAAAAATTGEEGPLRAMDGPTAFSCPAPLTAQVRGGRRATCKIAIIYLLTSCWLSAV